MLARCGVFSLAAWIGAFLVLRNTATTDFAGVANVAMLSWLPASVFGAASLAGPALRTERNAAWVLRACAMSAFAPLGATLLLMGVLFGGCGLFFGTFLGVTTQLGSLSRLRVATVTAAEGAVLSAIAASIVRMSTLGGAKDSVRVLALITCLLLASTLAIVWVREYSLLVWGAVALGAMAMSYWVSRWTDRRFDLGATTHNAC